MLARSPMRLFDRHVLTGFGFPVFGKGGVELHIQLPGGVL